jgi:hypothetical protein
MNTNIYLFHGRAYIFTWRHVRYTYTNMCEDAKILALHYKGAN